MLVTTLGSDEVEQPVGGVQNTAGRQSEQHLMPPCARAAQLQREPEDAAVGEQPHEAVPGCTRIDADRATVGDPEDLRAWLQYGWCSDAGVNGAACSAAQPAARLTRAKAGQNGRIDTTACGRPSSRPMPHAHERAPIAAASALAGSGRLLPSGKGARSTTASRSQNSTASQRRSSGTARAAGRSTPAARATAGVGGWTPAADGLIANAIATS